MKLMNQLISKKSSHYLGSHRALALLLAISPVLIFGYTPPRDQRPPHAPGGGSSSRFVEIGEISPLSL